MTGWLLVCFLALLIQTISLFPNACKNFNNLENNVSLGEMSYLI